MLTRKAILHSKPDNLKAEDVNQFTVLIQEKSERNKGKKWIRERKQVVKAQDTKVMIFRRV